MCSVCGCGEGGAVVEGHGPHHHHHHHPEHGEGPGGGPEHVHAPGMEATRTLRIEQDLLAENDRLAAVNRAYLERRGVFGVNLVSSPGSGKTTLLEQAIAAVGQECPVSVIEGDQQTSNDAERLRAAGAEARQVNTGKGCHLDAHMVGHALEELPAPEHGLLVIENVGNLICPSAFDLGEAAKVVVLSVTEGEDKPLKYPDMFHRADLVLLSKADLLPHLDLDADRCAASARQVNPGLEVIEVSAATGQGLDAWHRWLQERRQAYLRRLAESLEGRAAELRAAVGDPA